MKNYTQVIPYILLTLFIALLVFFGLITQDLSSKTRIPKAKSVTEVLYEGQKITLPSRVDVPAEEEYQIEWSLPETFIEPQTVLLRTSLQNVVVRLDGELLYEMNYEDKLTYASMWHFVNIPNNSQGQLLTIEYSSPYPAMAGVLNPISYGEFGSLMKDIFFSYGYRLIIGLLTLITGLAVMISGLFLYRKQNRPNVYLGLFAVFLGLWLISESRMIQLFTGNIYIMGSLAYMTLAILPIPLFAYLLFYVQKKFYPYFITMICIYSLYVPLIVVIEFLDIMDYFESAFITQILLVISMAITVLIIFLERLIYNNEQIKEIIFYIIIFAIFGLLEIITFFLANFSNISYFMSIGIALMMVMMIYNYTRFLMARFKSSYKNEFYKYLAYHDSITGAKNRLAYEQDFDQFFEDEERLSSLRLVYFDLDNLKEINDNYGHLEGDSVILAGYRIIEQTFGQYGTVYRIGGDEFACLVTSIDEETYKLLIKNFEALVRIQDQEAPYHFGLSLGSSIYQEDDMMPDDLVVRADHLMYEYKEKTKKTHK